MQSLAKTLQDLVRLPSVNPMGRVDIDPAILYERRVTDYWEAQFRELGVEYYRQEVMPGRSNIVAKYTPPTPAPFSLLFEAHQDTVPVDGMIIEPFSGNLEGGKLYGRGSCDVKGGGVAMFGAFARLVKERPPGSAAVTLAFTVDEEHTFLGVQHLMKSGFRSDFAVVAEPTQLDIVRAHKGVVRWSIDTTGVACHSSKPDNGVNAVYRMAKVIAAVEQFAKQVQASRKDAFLGEPTMSLGMIQGGVSPNTVPDKCRIEIDRRLIPGESPTEAVEALTKFIQTQTDVPFVVNIPRLACPPLKPTGGEEYVSRLGRAINEVKKTHEIVGVPYGTDASTVQEHGVPAVVFGPGDIAQAHTKDEWIEVAQLDQAAEVLYRLATGG